MPGTIRLMRIGKKAKPSYRIVVVDKRKKRSGSYIEKIGFYNPLSNPADLSLDTKRFAYWIGKGAIISEGIKKLKLHLQKNSFKP